MLVLVVCRDVRRVLLPILLVVHLVRWVWTVADALRCLGRIVAAYLFETDSHDLAQTVRTKRLNISKGIVLRPLVVAVHSLRHVEPGVYRVV